MGKVKIALVKGTSKRSPAQRATLVALGIKKMHKVIEKERNPAVDGMIAKVKHLLKVENS